METIQYVGEHLWVGKLGHFMIVTSFVSALLAAVAYGIFQHQGSQDQKWLKIGRTAFLYHTTMVIGLFGLIIYAMVNEMYEYSYVFDHVNSNLPGEYILSAFWEGQEGSFQLWMIWHVILGIILLFRKGKWEAPVLCVIAAVEVFLASMLLGVYIEIGDSSYKLGSNPLLLIRDVLEAPIFTNAEYLKLIEGRGLNPLLQNYWNVIHPPTTFLGFASTTIPFAFAIAGLWTRDHKGWLKPGLQWALFSGGILGTGILMGSFWAYEALTFGGYWAWDPVENGILVPWIILVAGIHTNLIARNTEYSIKSTYLFYLLTFILVVYATFLTRSGILGDTSVHSFTEMGLEWQLVAFMAFFVLWSAYKYFSRVKGIPAPKKEEATSSREFWMLIGSLVLFFSGVLIIASTSLPVFNTIMKVFDPNYVGKVIDNAVAHYDRYQIWIGVFVALLSSTTLFLRYRLSSVQKSLWIRLGVAVVGAIVGTWLMSLKFDLPLISHKVLAWSGFFGVILSLDYLITVAKAKPKASASAVSHMGFALMLLGILTSGTNKSHISSNPFMFRELISSDDAAKYVKLYKNKPLFAENHWFTWESDTLIDRTRYYDVRIDAVGPDEKIKASYRLRPSSLLSNDFTKIAAFNPDTKHLWNKDIFTNIAALPESKMDIEAYHRMEDTMQWVRYEVAPGETLDLETVAIEVEKIHFEPTHPQYGERSHDVGVAVDMTVKHKRRSIDTIAQVSPALGLDENLLYRYPIEIETFRTRIRLVDSLMDKVFIPEEQLDYQTYQIKQGESFNYEDFTIEVKGFDGQPKHKNYEAQQGDIAVGAELSIKTSDGNVYEAKPLYIIRNNQPFSIKDMIPSEGLSLRLSNINPTAQTFEFKVASQSRSDLKIPIEVAEKLPETNFIWFEARVFPGINLFWLGTIMMMVGLFTAWGIKRSAKD